MRFCQTFCFGGHDLTPYVLVTDVKRKVLPSRGIEQVTIPGMDGCLVSSVALEPLEVTVSCCITRYAMCEVTEARRALATCLSSKEPARLYLPDDDCYLMAIYEGGAEPSKLMQVPDLELTFLCPDPVAYGKHRTAEITSSGLVRTRGNYPARPVITSRPTGTSWKVTNVSTGEFVMVEDSFTGSQELVLDMASRRCTLNGSDHQVTMDSDFFAMDGDVTLMVTGSMTVEWDERWQ